jgi:hypothetical protein
MNDPTSPRHVDGNFLLLFGFMMVQLAILPIFEDNELLGMGSDLVFLGLVFYVVYGIRDQRLFLLSVVLFAGTLACYGLAFVYPQSVGVLIGINSVACAFLVTVMVSILRFIAKMHRITLDGVLGGLCVYLLIGVCFSMAHINIELMLPGSFDFGVHGAHPGFMQLYDLLYYYSFVTLLTIGYGDIVPISHLAQTLSVLEGVIGQFYLVFFVAVLVGMYLSGRMDDDAARGG